MSHALTRFRKLRERGKKIVEVQMPERVLRLLKQADPDTVRITFGGSNKFEIGAGELKEAIVETHRRNRRRGAV